MKQNILIIGGGIAGLETARQLLELGYTPIIVEKSNRLGGHVAQWHRLFPDMTLAADLTNSLIDAVKNANTFLDTVVSDIQKKNDEYVVNLNNGVTINVKVIVFASGFQIFDASHKEEYGYGIYEHVITNVDLERWMNGEKDVRVPSNIKSIGFVHCVGSRDLKANNSQCSKVCCMTAIKQAIEMKENFIDVEAYCFYMDLRLFGKKYEDFYINAQRDYGVHFVRGRISEVSEMLDKRVQVKTEDTLVGKPLKVQLDLLVLMAGCVCNKEIGETARKINLEMDNDGYLKSWDNIGEITKGRQPGIFYAGACTSIKTIPEALAEANTVALKIHSYLRQR